MRFPQSIFPILLVCLAGFSSLFGQDHEGVYESANRDFAERNFEQAASKYESLIEKGLLSPDLFYNLGTTYFRLEQPGQAMLSLRRAQFLDPTLPEAKQNIEVLRNRLGFIEFSDGKLDRFIRALPREVGTSLRSVSFWLALLSVTAALVAPGVTPYRSGLIGLGIVLVLFAIALGRMEQYRSTTLAPETFSIIVEENVKALTSPTPGAETVIDLPAGSEVRIIQTSGPWCYVDIPGDLRGWVRAELVKPVWPVSISS